MTSRVTRSSARLAAASAAATPSAQPPDPDHPQPHQRKRKASGPADPFEDHTPISSKPSPPRRSKRPRVTATEQLQSAAPPSNSRSSTKKLPAMAKPGSAIERNPPEPAINPGRSSPNPHVETDNTQTPGQESSKRKSSRNKKLVNGMPPSWMWFQVLIFDHRHRTFLFYTSCVFSPTFEETFQEA